MCSIRCSHRPHTRAEQNDRAHRQVDVRVVGSRYRHLMPLQNRVTPTGEIVATTARGTFMGNRGILHDEPSASFGSLVRTCG